MLAPLNDANFEPRKFRPLSWRAAHVLGGGLGSFSYLTRYTAAVGWITNLAPLKAARLVIIALIVLFTIVAATRKPKV